jgi:integrase/recombinase XerD
MGHRRLPAASKVESTSGIAAQSTLSSSAEVCSCVVYGARSPGRSIRTRKLSMASLYRKPVIITDPTTGVRTKTQSKKWWGMFKDADGRLRRHPLAVDKKAAQAMLNEMVKKCERQKAGLFDAVDQQRLRPLSEHVAEFRHHMQNKGIGEKQLYESLTQLEKVVAACKWKYASDINSASALRYLAELRENGRSAQTYNHYLRAIKKFTRWMVRDQRLQNDPLTTLAMLNTDLDRRHDRRALSVDEFCRLIDAARAGKRIEGIKGTDRAMMYLLAAWTGFRKGEIGSLTKRSLDLDGAPPTATVEACYSKRRRQDRQVLHPDLVGQLRAWLATKARVGDHEPLFPVSGRMVGGVERKTNKMLERDLEAAKKKWVEEAKTTKEKRERAKSDFLAYETAGGLFADFHSLRHLFITSLERAGITPKMAQTLARHSDIRLTLGVYTHIELHDQTAAIGTLAGPRGKVAVG